ncbi:MAG: cell division protein FtsQ/DivIB [Thermoanaerobaculia bacterium]
MSAGRGAGPPDHRAARGGAPGGAASRGPAPGGRVLPFRRRQFVARRRRRNPWLAMARAFGISALIVVAPLAAAAWVWQGSHFRLRRVEVSGCRHIAESWVRSQLEPLVGRPLLTLRLATVAERLRLNPWVDEVALEKRLPDGMRLVIDERVPVAMLRDVEGRLRYVDAEGEPIVAYVPGGGPADLPLVAGSDRPAHVAAAVAVVRDLARLEPEWGREISEIQVLGPSDFRVYTAEYRFPILLSAQRLDAGVEALRRHRRVLERAFPEVGEVDLRFERQIIIQPKET